LFAWFAWFAVENPGLMNVGPCSDRPKRET
jgi:hypothetical protein